MKEEIIKVSMSDEPERCNGSEPYRMVILDVNAIPHSHGISAEKWLHIFREANLCLYDSTQGEKPEIVEVKPEELDVEYLDLSRQEHLKKWNNYKKRIK